MPKTIDKEAKLIRAIKARNTRARKKHFRTIKDLRAKIIAINFKNHDEHGFIAVDTHYYNDIFMCEYIWCGCNNKFKITKTMLEDIYGKEYALCATK